MKNNEKELIAKQKELIDVLTTFIENKDKQMDFILSNYTLITLLKKEIAELESSPEQEPTQMPTDDFKYDESLYNILNRFYADSDYKTLDAIKDIENHFKSRLSSSNVAEVNYSEIEKQLLDRFGFLNTSTSVVSVNTENQAKIFSFMDWLKGKCIPEISNVAKTETDTGHLIDMPEVRQTITDSDMQTYFANHSNNMPGYHYPDIDVMTESEAIAMVKHFLKLK